MTESRERVRASVIESVPIAVAGAAAMVGSLLPWAYAKSFTISPGQNPDEVHAVTGGDFDGEVVAVFVWATWIALATMDLLSSTPSRSLPEDFLVVPGYGFGLIVTVVAAVGGTLVSFVWLIRSQIRTS